VFVTESAVLGGSVPPTSPPAAGAEADAKLAAAAAAQLAAVAQAKGRSPALARALVLPEARVCAWTDEAGKVCVAEAMPDRLGAERILLLDTADTVLVLTKDQALRVGLAKGVAATGADLGAALGLAGWKSAGDYAEKVFARIKTTREQAEARKQKAFEQNLERTKTALAFVQQNIDEADREDPRRFSYGYEVTTGTFTPESVQRWKKQTDAAIAAWRRVQAGLKTLADLEKEGQALGLTRSSPGWNTAELFARAQREIVRLVDQRNKNRV